MTNSLEIHKTELAEILPLRDLFLLENKFQIRYHAVHARNWSDSYLLKLNGEKVGYGSVKGQDDLKNRDSIFEFYLIPSFRKRASNIFSDLLKTCHASFIECQSNEPLLTSMMHEFGENIHADVILFGDALPTNLNVPNVEFRARREGDVIFEHKMEPVGSHVLVLNDVVIATGGFMTYYNEPFVDLYMEVEEKQPRKGFGSFLLQELKKECYRIDRLPAARCDINNANSRATLIKAGLGVCGFMLTGKIRKIFLTT